MKPEFCAVPDDAIDGNIAVVVVPNKMNVSFLAFATKLALSPDARSNSNVVLDANAGRPHKDHDAISMILQ
jgi:hypothetical protein